MSLENMLAFFLSMLRVLSPFHNTTGEPI